MESILYFWFGARCKRVCAVSLERFRCMCDHLRQGKIEGVSFVHIRLRPILCLCASTAFLVRKNMFMVEQCWTIKTWWSQPPHMWSCGTSSKGSSFGVAQKMGIGSDRDRSTWAFKKRMPAFCLNHMFACVLHCIHQQTDKLCAHAEMQIETKKHRHRNALQVMLLHHLRKTFANELHQVSLVLLYLQCFCSLQNRVQVSHWKAVFKFHIASSFEIISNQS